MKWIHPNDTHPMKEIVGAEVFNEVIRLDRYGIREFNRRHKEYEVLTVVDVGANVGYFSVMASCLFPSTKRIAIEPANLTHEMLVENVNGWNVRCVKMAIGDGGRMSIVADPRCCGSDVMVPDVNGEYPSSRLSAILKAEGVAKQGLILKVDCEGGERWLVDDSDLDEWMKGCIYFAAEFHETPSNPKTAWKEWLARVFGRHCVKEFLIGPYRNMMIYYYTMEKGSIQ